MMDLRREYPRSVKERAGGYVHLLRMIDKCRALHAGIQGEYKYPCPMDQRLLDFSGITADQFLQAVPGRSDADMVDWFVRTATPHQEAELEAWNGAMLTLGPDTEEKWKYFRNIRDAIDPSRDDVSTWADLLDLEEDREVPLRERNRGTRA